ncbi:FecCD family ABC transporter permease [Paraliobacillus sp. JSM ZJ581]|uniref:FecCD family ABC transporter permease n=1 Tax=Paraliobacillus sp. JSM ZJ581 TaxID=3342118 RepID=UPI0035A99F43
MPFILQMILACCLMLSALLIALVFGAADITVVDLWYAIIDSDKTDMASIIWEIRFPREVAAVFVGGGLAVAGALMQGLTRNPLADPGLLGLTTGANLALAITLAWLPTINYFGILLACFLGAGVGASLVFSIASIKRGGFSSFRIVLAGAAISAFLGAIAEAIGLYFHISKDISMWTAGGLIGSNWQQLSIIIPCMIGATIIALFLGRQLTILSFNEEVAVGLGQRTRFIKALLFVVIIILTGSSVALVGNLTFVGLMIPHIVRAMVGSDYRFIIPISAFVGASFLLLADTLARTLHAPYETPIAAIVSILGLPFFLFLVHKGGKTFS